MTLDRMEGIGYHSVRIWVVAGGTTATAYTYVARPGHVDTQLRPYAWYRDLVVRSAEHHGFPRDYIHMIATHVIQDPDPLRRALHAALLARIHRQGHSR